MIVEDDDDDISEVVVPEPRSKRRGKAAAPPATNGMPLSKAKGKGKGKAASTANGHKSGSDPVIIEELDDDEPLVAKPLPAKKGKTRAGSPFVVEDGEIVEETESASSPELERMREERDLVRFLSASQYVTRSLNCVVQYKTKSEELSETLLKLIQERNTEPEEQLAVMKAQYDAATNGARLLLDPLLPTYLDSSARGAHQGTHHANCASNSHVKRRSRVNYTFPHA